ncbi:YbaK/EbsC family protein [Clostridium sp. D2Q-11]|uniref:YbaK/EbsC family protein n=1 Tax=Anaeromonas frigoriresistens TaxID=2683708 RepID=A0A942USW6_9FIRM|nr:YbaK/EbsC family protein [Anaeromonas frigoriresistens]
MYDRVINLLKEANVEYNRYKHQPILDYDTAKEVKDKYNLSGVESKSLFIKSKSDEYYIFITVENKKMDSKRVKKLIGEKVSIASGEELLKKTGCIPGCASPFGYDKDISIIVDREIFNYNKFLFSPGIAEITIQIKSEDLRKILEVSNNNVIYY